MTKDEILNMPAGHEMNALIADRFNLYSNNPVVGDRYERGKGYIKQYSTDIAAAWEVLEKLNTSFSLGKAWRLNNPEWTGYSLWISGDAATGETAPLAICRAALLAVMK